MRIALNVAGVLCLLMGAVWFLQVINVLLRSFMSGQSKRAICGCALLQYPGWAARYLSKTSLRPRV